MARQIADGSLLGWDLLFPLVARDVYESQVGSRISKCFRWDCWTEIGENRVDSGLSDVVDVASSVVSLPELRCRMVLLEVIVGPGDAYG